MAKNRVSKTSRSFPVRESGLAAARLGRAALEAAGCFILDPECRIGYASAVTTVLVRGGMESAVRDELARLSVVVGAPVVLWDGKAPVVSKEAINADYSSLVRENRAKGIPAVRARELARKTVDNRLALIREAHALRGYAVVALPVRSGLREAINAIGAITGVVGVVQREIGSGSSDSQSHINPNLPRPVGLRRIGFTDQAALAADRKENPPERLRKAPAPAPDNSGAMREVLSRIRDKDFSPSGLLSAEALADLKAPEEAPGFRHADGGFSPVGSRSIEEPSAPERDRINRLKRLIAEDGAMLGAVFCEARAWEIDL